MREVECATGRDKSYGDCADSVEVSFLPFSQILRGTPTQALELLRPSVNCETKENCYCNVRGPGDK